MSGRQSAPSTRAAGLKALKVTYDHARRQTGVMKALVVLGQANQKSGFDCPGCAWPDPEDRSIAEFCENGAKAILDESTNHRVDPEFFQKHSIAELSTKSERWLNAQGRLTHPMFKPPGATHYEPISYKDAAHLIAKNLRDAGDPGSSAFYTSGRTSNEAAFLYQLLARTYGTNNLPDCSNLCHESSGVALKESLGIGKGTVRLSDFAQADLIFVIGQNPGTNHPRMLSALREAKLAGATIVSINPLIEPGLVRFSHPQEPSDLLGDGVDIADHFVRVRVNGDLALFRGLNKSLLEAEAEHPSAIDRSFIGQYTHGIEALEAQAASSAWDEITVQSGVSREEIDRLCALVQRSKGIICCWAMGLTQHENAVVTIQEIANFLLLRGNVGKPGAGACPVRGHSNVQGDRSVGIAPTLPDAFRENMEHHFNIRVPQERGLDSVGTILKMHAGELRTFISLGGNFLSACPDTEFTQEALQRCDLTVQISTKLNRSHLVTGDSALILPCLGRSERDDSGDRPQIVSVENSMGVVHTSRGKLAPAHPDLWSETRIVCAIAQELFKEGPGSSIPWNELARDYSLIRDRIASVVPGFTNYNSRLNEPGGFELDNGPRERRFTTASGQAQFLAAPLRRIEPEPGELILMTLRSHDQFNTTVYSNEDRYRGVSGSRKILMLCPADMKTRGISPGTPLEITSHFRTPKGEPQTRKLNTLKAMPYDVPEGTAVAYFPEANPLIFVESHAHRSRTPTSKSVRITLRALS